MWILGILLILVGIGLTVAYFFQKKKLELILLTKTYKIKEIKELAESIAKDIGGGNFKQLVEVKGRIKCDTPLISELANLKCVYYSMNVKREYEETYYVTDTHGRKHRRTRVGSESVSSNKRFTDFFVNDGSGEIKINPEGASITPEKVLSKFVPAKYTQGNYLRFGNFSFNIGNLLPLGDRKTLGYRYEEEIIPVGKEIYVLGEVNDRYGELQINKPKEKEMIISVKSEEEILRETKKIMLFLFIGSIALSLGGVIIIILNLLGILR